MEVLPNIPSHQQITFIYGRQNVNEFLKSKHAQLHRPFHIIIHKSLPSKIKDTLYNLYRNTNCKFSVCKSLKELDQLFPNIRHQGVVLCIKDYTPKTDINNDWRNICKKAKGPIILLANLQDIQNIGNIARSSEALGVRILISCGGNVKVFSDQLGKISSGAIYHLDLFHVTNTHRCIRILKDMGFFICGTTSQPPIQTTHNSVQQPLTLLTTQMHALPKKQSLVFIIGEEHSGLKLLIKRHCDYLIHIPLHGKIQSLNAATAAAIVLERAINLK